MTRFLNDTAEVIGKVICGYVVARFSSQRLVDADSVKEPNCVSVLST